MPKKVKKFFYQLSVDESIQKLKTHSEKGLSKKEVDHRQKEYGLNQLKEVKRKSYFWLFLSQFQDLMIVVLIIAALLAYYLDDFRGGTILLVIVLVNALIGFYQEFKAEKILESLKKLVQPNATVIRNGQKKEIPQVELVPGDLVFLEEGSAIPADIRLIQTNHFSTNDFILTGESVPQEKKADLTFQKEITITNQDNLVFLGTTVAKGNALGVVYGTGMNTEIGRIAQTSNSIHTELSPLQKEMNSLAKMLTLIATIIAISLFVINLALQGNQADSLNQAIQLSLLFAIGVAAASVPQGLPAQVSVALSLGVGRMAKRKAVVRKLSAVETLGSTSVICTDKTGTLTKNEMTITHVVVHGHTLKVTGEGYGSKGVILMNNKKLTKTQLSKWKPFFSHGFLAGNGRVNPPDKDHRYPYAVGDPTEAAFTPLAIKAGLKVGDLDKNYPKIKEFPFDSDRKRMTILRKHKKKIIAYQKGALESVLSTCTHYHDNSTVKKLTPKIRKELLQQGESYAQKSLRVIALAYRDFSPSFLKATNRLVATGIDEIEKSFTFSGFVTMFDPPRQGVKQAVKASYQAHIRLVMITGDNAVTAQAIAQQIGMIPPKAPLPPHNSQTKAPQKTRYRAATEPQLVYTGDEVKKIKDTNLKEILKQKATIFSRVSPEDKLRIVQILKRMGEVVAVTGDGVNDTLSLKRADIGVSMGKMGSEVAKEASEMVLLDDNFRTITSAISEGRTIFKNLKKTILSSITSNNGELSCVLLGFVGVAFGLPAPITAVQILAIDLVGEMLPLTALTFDPPEKHILKEKPRNLNEHIINRKSLMNLLFYGFWMGAAGYFSFYMVHVAQGASIESGRAAAYVGIILCQYINILSRRTEKSVFTSYLFTNPQLWGSFFISILAVIILIYIPQVAIWFGFRSLAVSDWLFPITGAIVFLAWHELRKDFVNH